MISYATLMIAVLAIGVASQALDEVRFHLTFNTSATNGTNHGFTSQIMQTYTFLSYPDGISPSLDSWAHALGQAAAVEFISTPVQLSPTTFAVPNATIAFLGPGPVGTLEFSSTGSGGVLTQTNQGQHTGSIQYTLARATGAFAIDGIEGAGADVFIAPVDGDYFTVHFLGVLYVPVQAQSPKSASAVVVTTEGKKLRPPSHGTKGLVFPYGNEKGSQRSGKGKEFGGSIFHLTFQTVSTNNVNQGSANMPQLHSTMFDSTRSGIPIKSTHMLPAVASIDSPLLAGYLSTVASPTNNTFTESGIIQFGSLPFQADGPHTIMFNSTGSGGVVQTNSDASYGSIQYLITGGTGSFQGATGAMMDFFVARPGAASFDIVVLGWIALP